MGLWLLALLVLAMPMAAHAQSSTLEAVRSRGYVKCGIAGTVAGFSLADKTGQMHGIDIDGCRALTAAVFGDPSRVKYIVTTTQNRFTALQAGDIDVLFREATWSLSREASLGLLGGVPYFYDGTGFLVKVSAHIKSVNDLGGATICVQPGTSTELAVADYFRTHHMTLIPVEITDLQQIEEAFFAGRCDALSTDRSALAGIRAIQGAKAKDYMLLPEIISKEPLAPMVRKGDDKWFDLLRWVSFAQLNAEELGITSQNADQMRQSANPDIRRLLGVDGGLGSMLGVSDSWAFDVIKSVGNTEEVWNRNMAPLDIPRDYNRLWDRGGIAYAPPMR